MLLGGLGTDYTGIGIRVPAYDSDIPALVEFGDHIVGTACLLAQERRAGQRSFLPWLEHRKHGVLDGILNPNPLLGRQAIDGFFRGRNLLVRDSGALGCGVQPGEVDRTSRESLSRLATPDDDLCSQVEKAIIPRLQVRGKLQVGQWVVANLVSIVTDR